MGHGSWAFPREGWEIMLHSNSWCSWDFNSVDSCRFRGDKQRKKTHREKATEIKPRSRTSLSEEHRQPASPKLALAL